MDWNMKRILLLLLMLVAGPVLATDRYVCDCNTTNAYKQPHASCAAGSSGNTGLSSSSPKQLFSQLSDPTTWAAGDRVFWCQGGVHREPVAIERNNNATRANPIVFGAYDPPSGATGKPVLFRTTVIGGATIEIGGNSDTALGSTDVDGDGTGDGHGGYTIQDLDFQCDGTSDPWAVRFRAPIHSINITGNTFGHCGIGVRFEQQSGSDAYRIKLAVVSDNTFHDNPGLAGFNGGCSDCDIENNTFTGNGAGSSTTHAIYAGCGLEGSIIARCDRMRFRKNTLTDNSVDVNGRCIGGNLTTRGRQTNTVIEGNVIKITAGTRSGNCVGISHAEGYAGTECMDGSKIRNNVMAGVARAVWVGSVQNGFIENNVFIDVSTEAVAAPGFLIGGGGNFESGIDCGMLNNTLRGNTAYFVQPFANSRGITVEATGGTGNVICNNLIAFGSNPNTTYYTTMNTGTATYTEVCNNLGNGGSGWTSSNATTASFEGVAAFNASGHRTGAPVLVGTPSVANHLNACIQTTSDAKDTGDVSRAPRLSFAGYVRDATPDIGFCEFGRNP